MSPTLSVVIRDQRSFDLGTDVPAVPDAGCQDEKALAGAGEYAGGGSPAGWTRSSGQDCHSVMPSLTESVIVEIVCFDSEAPWTSARCAEISPCVSPFPDSKSTISSTPVSRRCRFLTRGGSKLPTVSRGTAISREDGRQGPPAGGVGLAEDPAALSGERDLDGPHVAQGGVRVTSPRAWRASTTRETGLRLSMVLWPRTEAGTGSELDASHSMSSNHGGLGWQAQPTDRRAGVSC